MKHILLTVSFLCLFPALSCMSSEEMPTTGTTTVYICTGPKAKVYHSTPKCKGLNQCSGEIKAVSYESVKNRRMACRICY